MEDMELGDLGVVAVLPVDLRLIIALNLHA
jgi:hypothetical protein